MDEEEIDENEGSNVDLDSEEVDIVDGFEDTDDDDDENEDEAFE